MPSSAIAGKVREDSSFWDAAPWAPGCASVIRETRALVFGGSRTAQHWCSRGRRLPLIPSNSHINVAQVAWQPSQDRHTTPDDKKCLWQWTLWGGGSPSVLNFFAFNTPSVCCELSTPPAVTRGVRGGEIEARTWNLTQTHPQTNPPQSLTQHPLLSVETLYLKHGYTSTVNKCYVTFVTFMYMCVYVTFLTSPQPVTVSLWVTYNLSHKIKFIP